MKWVLENCVRKNDLRLIREEHLEVRAIVRAKVRK